MVQFAIVLKPKIILLQIATVPCADVLQGLLLFLGWLFQKPALNSTKEILKKRRLLKRGDVVVNLASMPANEKGMTNMMKISKV